MPSRRPARTSVVRSTSTPPNEAGTAPVTALASRPTVASSRVPPCTASNASRWTEVPTYGDCHTAEISVSPQACFDALTDYERLPKWQGAVKHAQILERDAQG